MKLSLTPKGAHPDMFELNLTDIRIGSKQNPNFEARSPFKCLSQTYQVHTSRRIKTSELVGRLFAFSVLPALLLYYAIDVGWFLVVLAALAAVPNIFVIRSALRKPLTHTTFIEHADGNFAFYIPYYQHEEEAVLKFVCEIQRRIEVQKAA